LPTLRHKTALGQTVAKINKGSAMNTVGFSKLFNYSLRPLFTHGSPRDAALSVSRNQHCRRIQYANRPSTDMPKNIFERKSLHRHSITVILTTQNGICPLYGHSL
jgi:hypothetical protein